MMGVTGVMFEARAPGAQNLTADTVPRWKARSLNCPAKHDLRCNLLPPEPMVQKNVTNCVTKQFPQ